MRLSSSPYPFVVGPRAGSFSLDLVRDLRNRPARDFHKLFLAEGTRFAVQALAQKASVFGLVYAPKLLQGTTPWSVVDQIQKFGVPILKVSPPEYRALSPGVSSPDEEGNAASRQGLLIVLRQRWESLPPTVQRDECWIGVEGIQTPGNLGTLLRSGDAAGATGLIVFDRSAEGSPSGADPYDNQVVRASMGSIFAHRMIRTTHSAFRKWPARKQLSVVGATPSTMADYRELDYRKSVVLMLGHERTGLSEGQINSCDRLARIPMVGNPDSLNLAMAGTLMLYEVHNQRRPVHQA